MVGEKVVSLGLAFLVSVAVARYLGPENFGILSYALSLASVFAVAGHLGLGGLVVRELVADPDQRAATLGTAVALKALAYALSFLALVTVAWLTETAFDPRFWVLVLVASSVLFKPAEVVEFWFHAQTSAKYVSLSRLLGGFASGALQLGLVWLGVGIIGFAFAPVLTAFVVAASLIGFAIIKCNLPLGAWRISRSKAKLLLSQGSLVFLGSIFAVMYLKIDQIMLNWLAGPREVGIYAVASTLSEAWYFVPSAIVLTVFPKLIELRKSGAEEYRKRLQQLLDILFCFALLVGVIASLFAKPFIAFFYGSDFLAAATILQIHVWAGLFISMRALLSKWILLEGLFVFSLVTQGLGAISNILLNLVLIPHAGGLGAAVATLFSYAVASYFSLLFSARSRPMFFMMTSAIVSPLRYVYFLVRYRSLKFV